LVGVEPEPAQPLVDRALRGLGVALLVGVLQAEDELAALVAGEEPVEQGGARAAHVEVPRRRRRKTDADGVFHGVSDSRRGGTRTRTGGGGFAIHGLTTWLCRPNSRPAACLPQKQGRGLYPPMFLGQTRTLTPALAAALAFALAACASEPKDVSP